MFGLDGWRGDGWRGGPHHGWGGPAWIMVAMMLAVLVLTVVAVVLVLRGRRDAVAVGVGGTAPVVPGAAIVQAGVPPATGDAALEAARMRYASGAIDREAYVRIVRDLGGWLPPEPGADDGPGPRADRPATPDA